MKIKEYEFIYDGIKESDVNPLFCEHHTALCQGYVRVGQIIVRPYYGRFGKGYCFYRHNPHSTRYCFVTYYIDKERATL